MAAGLVEKMKSVQNGFVLVSLSASSLLVALVGVLALSLIVALVVSIIISLVIIIMTQSGKRPDLA